MAADALALRVAGLAHPAMGEDAMDPVLLGLIGLIAGLLLGAGVEHVICLQGEDDDESSTRCAGKLPQQLEDAVAGCLDAATHGGYGVVTLVAGTNPDGTLRNTVQIDARGGIFVGESGEPDTGRGSALVLHRLKADLDAAVANCLSDANARYHDAVLRPADAGTDAGPVSVATTTLANDTAAAGL